MCACVCMCDKRINTHSIYRSPKIINNQTFQSKNLANDLLMKFTGNSSKSQYNKSPHTNGLSWLMFQTFSKSLKAIKAQTSRISPYHALYLLLSSLKHSFWQPASVHSLATPRHLHAQNKRQPSADHSVAHTKGTRAGQRQQLTLASIRAPPESCQNQL